MNWTDILACPEDGDSLFETENDLLTCEECRRKYPIWDGIPRFEKPPDGRREWVFETKRYDRVAKENPASWGLDETHPETRNQILFDMIMRGRPYDSEDHVPFYLNIGQGFGGLEDMMHNSKHKVCLDQSLEFLRRVQERMLPNTWLVKGFAERMPFKDEVFPCVVSDSVFQTVTDQKEYLFENARVLKSGGLFLMATAYKWNYPRKPQLFPVSKPELLLRFLHELGIEAEHTYYDLGSNITPFDLDSGDYVVVQGTKQ